MIKEINERLINEYISKVGCCDECFASIYCTVNGLRESRVPQDYCVQNIKRYFGDKAKPVDTLGDLISREALKEALAKKIKTNDMGLWLKILLVIDNATPVDMPKHSLLPLAGDCDEAYKRGYEHGKAEALIRGRTKGEWVPKYLRDNTHIWVCSECGNKNRYGITVEKACWKCGADMRKSGEAANE